MADLHRVERLLAVTRAHFRAPPDARVRVRAELTARGQLGTDYSSAVRSGKGAGVTKTTAAMLAGLTFIAGVWIGRQSARDAASHLPPLPPSAVAPPIGPALAPGPAGPAPSANEAVSAAARSERGGASETAPARSLAPGGKERKRRTEHATPAAPQRERPAAEELALLQRAERAIRSGEPELALSFLDDIERRFPSTSFREEREAARLLAGCARAEPESRAEAESRARAERFVRERRTSVYADRVRSLCKLEPEPSSRDGSAGAGH